MFLVRETPRVVAGSIAAAVTWGTAPFFVGALGLPLTIWIFRLNKVLSVSFTVLLLANPLMMLLMLVQTWLGLVIMGEPVPAWLKDFDFSNIMVAIKQSRQLLVAYAVGGYAFAVVSGLLTLAILWPVLEWRKARKKGRVYR